jgi:hypothetical protein
MQKSQLTQSSEVCTQDIVCILGMHRSGTSLLTRIVNLIGVYLGPDDGVLTVPAVYNPTGHWEHEEITSICKAILKRHGGSWDEPPEFPRQWETAPGIDDLKHRSQRLIRDQFAQAPLWGWKDPRTCITLPFWQQLLPNLRYLICLRNPVDVARSLAHRDSFSEEKSSYLWLTYVCSVLNQTEGKPRLIIFYEDLVDDCLGELQRLAEFLGEPERAKQTNVQQAVLQFVEKRLQHYHTDLAQTVPRSRLDLYARALYIAQRISSSFDPNGTKGNLVFDSRIDEAVDNLSRYALQLSSQSRPAKAALTESNNRLKTLSTQLADLTRALRSQPQNVEEVACALSAQLMEIQTQLPRMRDRLSRRLLTRYRHIKSYLLPIYRHYFRAFAKTSPPTSAQEWP